ncbi:MAG: hypothetical protein IH629_00185 [Thermoleophilia bacterium]|nr:hypothetical protein [Thermoleophilia bacterium]
MPNDTDFTLASGRTIRLLALDQYFTYEGLLLGMPTREMNQEMIDRLIARYVHPAEYGVPLLLKPEQQPLEVPEHRPVHGTPATLPSVTCIARFNSDGQLGTDDIWSVLRLIWFQEDFALPIEERVLQQIAEIDWETHARGWEP